MTVTSCDHLRDHFKQYFQFRKKRVIKHTFENDKTHCVFLTGTVTYTYRVTTILFTIEFNQVGLGLCKAIQ